MPKNWTCGTRLQAVGRADDKAGLPQVIATEQEVVSRIVDLAHIRMLDVLLVSERSHM